MGKSMDTDLLELVKKTGVTRKFKNKDIPDSAIDKILEAGNWGFSVMGIKPWNFVCITNKEKIESIADVMINNSKNIPRTFGIIANLTAKTIANSSAVIAVYNTKKVSLKAEKYGGEYLKRVYMAELQSIGGVIQNMCLEAGALGIGFIWTDSPAFFNDEINDILEEKDELLALLVLGYSDEILARSKRSLSIEAIKRFR